jgi:hypothetical protein
MRRVKSSENIRGRSGPPQRLLVVAGHMLLSCLSVLEDYEHDAAAKERVKDSLRSALHKVSME